jgi:hypothetical protein
LNPDQASGFQHLQWENQFHLCNTFYCVRWTVEM